jgi:hypothetical protein
LTSEDIVVPCGNDLVSFVITCKYATPLPHECPDILRRVEKHLGFHVLVQRKLQFHFFLRNRLLTLYEALADCKGPHSPHPRYRWLTPGHAGCFNVAQPLPGSSLRCRSSAESRKKGGVPVTDDVFFDDKEKLTFLFQPDTLLSHQYFATFRRRQLEPEKRLMLAVLEDAVACFQSYVFAESRRTRALFNEAEDWIRNENSDYVFSFENICAALKISPTYVRKGLLRWKSRRLAERQNIKPIDILSPRHETVIRKHHDTNRMVKSLKSPYQENKIAGLG